MPFIFIYSSDLAFDAAGYFYVLMNDIMTAANGKHPLSM